MLRIPCPWCGLRDEAEFAYRGDAGLVRPEDGDSDAMFAHVYQRANPAGWHLEWWHHVHGCRQHVKVLRNTLTHEIAAAGWSGDDLEVPEKAESNGGGHG